MIIYAHRGNLNGPDLTAENHPQRVELAIAQGFHAEIDLRRVHGKLWLGHDTESWNISEDWLNRNFSWLLIHAKNLEAAHWLSRQVWHWFSHVSDPFVSTSYGFVWVHDPTLPMSPTNRAIIPLITLEAIQARNNFHAYGICTDYPIKLRELMKTI